MINSKHFFVYFKFFMKKKFIDFFAKQFSINFDLREKREKVFEVITKSIFISASRSKRCTHDLEHAILRMTSNTHTHKYTHTHSHVHKYTHTHTLTHIHSFSHALAHMHSLTHAPHIYTHTYTNTHSLTLTHSHT